MNISSITSRSFTPALRQPSLVATAPVALKQQTLPADQFTLSAPVATPEVSAKESASEPSWHRDQVIYFPLTDRFNDGDPTNNFQVNRDHPAGFWGGDLKGLTEKLDYIKSTGATSIWLSPLAENTKEFQIGDYHGHGYHGYWIKDHYNVEEHQGDLSDAKRLVDEAHKRDLKVVLDVVLNHTGPDHPFALDPSKEGWFHNEGGINDWNDPRQVERGDLGGLPDFDQDNPETYKYLMDNTLWWIKETGVDGIRLDAVKHVSKDFWARFIPEVKERSGKEDLFVMGEAFHGDPNVVADYQKAGIDYLFDLPLYYTMKETFGQGQSFRKLAERLDQDELYPDPGKLVTVLDNHDLPRFLSTARDSFPGEADKRLKQAMAFQMAVRGVPSVYYGTESGFDGGDDPYNREMMEFDTRPDLKNHMRSLADVRSGSEALRRGAQLEMWQDDDVYAFSRQSENSEAVAVFHNGSADGYREIPLRAESRLSEGDVMVDALSGREFTVRDGKLSLHLEPLTPLILEPRTSRP